MKIYVDKKPDNCDLCIFNDRCSDDGCLLVEFHKNTYSFTKSITKGVKSSILSNPNNNPLKLLDNKKEVLEKLKDKMHIVKKDIELYERRTGITLNNYSDMIYAWILIYVYENYISKCNNEVEAKFIIERLNLLGYNRIQEEILTIFCDKYGLKMDELYEDNNINSSLFNTDNAERLKFNKFKQKDLDVGRIIRYDGKKFDLIQDEENYFAYSIDIYKCGLCEMYLFDSLKNTILRYWCNKLEKNILFSIPEEYEDKFEMITHLYEKSLEKI